MGPEGIIEKYMKDKAEEKGFLYFKFRSPGNNGVPDRILVGHGLTFFVELKAPGEKPRKLQERVIAKIQKHGGIVYVIDTKQGVDELFEQLLQSCQSETINKEDNA